jgi:hypothetical protein
MPLVLNILPGLIYLSSITSHNRKNAFIMKEPLVVPTKCIAPTGGIIVFIWPILLQNDMRFTTKQLFLHLTLKSRSQVNFKFTNEKTMHDLLLIDNSNRVSIGHILRDIVDFTIIWTFKFAANLDF